MKHFVFMQVRLCEKMFTNNCITGNAVHEIQKERAQSNMYLTSNASTIFTKALKEQRDLTNSQLQVYMNYVNGLAPTTLFANNMFRNVSSFPSLRTRVDILTVSGIDCAGNFSALIRSVLDFVMQYSLEKSVGAVNDLVSFNTLMSMKETLGRQRADGIVVATNNRFNSTDDYVQMVQLVAFEQSLLSVLNAESSKERMAILNPVLSSSQATAVNNITKMFVKNPNAQAFNVDPAMWLNLTTTLINMLKVVEDKWAELFTKTIQSKINTSIAYVVVTCVLILLFFLLALISSIILSKTIVGPWKRMLDLQVR